MTGSSKLFNTRRIRFGARNNSIAESSSELSLPPRTTAERRNHHRNNRHDLGSCNPNPNPRSEHVHVEQGRGRPPSGSIINSEDFRSIRRWGGSENDRLPGVVLLARERLLERLRGVRVSENRQSNTSSSSIHQDDSSYGSFRVTNSNHVQESVSESWQAVLPLSSMTRMLPRGLSEHELNLLSVTVFNNVKEVSNESCSPSKECSICLEGFEYGEKLIKLSCVHMFHSGCLLPWAEVCGACPNCRKDIVVGSSN